MALSVAAAQPQTDWAVVLVTALGGSIVGGVFGGLLTTWLRGRIEQHGAWTTRLIDAADNYCERRMQALVIASDSLQLLEDPHSQAWHADSDEPLKGGNDEIKKMNDAEDAAQIAFERVRLLFRPDSMVAEKGDLTVNSARQMVRALNGQGTSPEGSTATNLLAVKWIGVVYPDGSRKPRLVAAREFFQDAQQAHLDFMRECEGVLKPDRRPRRGTSPPPDVSRLLETR